MRRSLPALLSVCQKHPGIERSKLLQLVNGRSRVGSVGGML